MTNQNETAAESITVVADAKGSRRGRRIIARAADRLSPFSQTRKDQRALKKFWKQQLRKTPHELVLVIATILERHPDVRKAFKEALRLR